MASIEPIERYKNGKKKPREKCRVWRIYAYTGVRDRVSRKYDRRTKNVHGMTETEARLHAERWEAELRRVRSSTMLWTKWVDLWLEAREADPNLSPSTIKRDRNRSATLKLLWPEPLRLCDITVAECEAVILYLRTKGSPHGKKTLKPSYIASIETSISEVIEEAVRGGLMPSNPMRRVRSRTRKNEATHENTPTVDQLSKLVGMLDPRDRYQMAVMLCACLGLRRGEALGLRWCDVDFSKKLVRIRQALKDDGLIGPPKTPTSVRTLTLTPSLADALKIRRAQQEADFRASVKVGLLDAMPDMGDCLVYADALGRATRVQSLDSWWYRHRSQYGLACTIHELRHGHLSMLAALGVHPATMMAIAGHRSEAITLQIYTRANDAMVSDAFGLVEQALTVELDVPEEG